MKLFPVLLLLPAALAQSICINSGGPSIPPPTTDACGFTADQYSTTGNIWGPGSPGYVPLPTGIWSTLRYAQTIVYNIPRTNGFYQTKFDILEPTLNGPGLRRFTITANGVTSMPLDAWMLSGGLGIPYQLPLGPVQVTDGYLHISCLADTIPQGRSNCVISAIEVTPVPPPSSAPLGVPCVSLAGYTLRAELPDGTCLPIRIWDSQGPLASGPGLRAWWPDANAPAVLQLNAKDCPAYWTETGIPCIVVASNDGQGVTTYVPVGIPVAH